MQELIVNILLAVVILTAAVLLFFVGNRKGSMTKKQRTMMIRILITAIVLFCLQFLSADTFDQLDGYLFPSAGRILRFACYLADYFIIGYDILRKAVKGIRKFSSNTCPFLGMTGRLFLREYLEDGNF